MDLFDIDPDPSWNLLPVDGTVNYFGKLFNTQEADYYFDRLLSTIEWKNDEAIIMGKLIITRRKAAWYGDGDFEYTYSKVTKKALPWTPELVELKRVAEEQTGETFNSCLLNLYHSGEEGMSWHSDAEKDLKKDGAIASMSFGAAREFRFRHRKSKQTIRLNLEHGSLLVMKGTTQTHWLHSLPKSARIKKPRINLTFRTVVNNRTANP